MPRSGRYAMLLGVILLGSLALGGCGSGKNEALAAACKAHCDAQATATGCTDLTDTLALCRQVCDAFAIAFSGECAALAEAQYNCLKGATWSCGSGGNVPQPDNEACRSESEAFTSKCTVQQVP